MFYSKLEVFQACEKHDMMFLKNVLICNSRKINASVWQKIRLKLNYYISHIGQSVSVL